MSRRHTLADRLARLEAAHDAGLWHFTLTDGQNASLPVDVVLDAMADAFDRLGDPDAEHPPASKALRLLARVADGTEGSLLGRTAIQLAREVVE